MMLMMLAVHSKNRRRDYADDFRFLRHLPSESMTMMLMMLVLFVCDHLCQALVRLAASYPRAFFKRADDAAFLDRLPAKSGQHGIIMHLRRQRPQGGTIDIASWFEVACRKQASIIRIIVILFGPNVCPKDSIISIASLRFLSKDSKHHQKHLLFILGGSWCAR